MFDQLLVKQVADNYSIDPVDSLELVLNHGFDINFSENIIIKAKKKAFEKVKKYCASNVFWVNRSKLS